MTRGWLLSAILLLVGVVLDACGGGGGGGGSTNGPNPIAPPVHSSPSPTVRPSPTPCPTDYTGTPPNCTAPAIVASVANGLSFAALGTSAAATVTISQAGGTISEADTCQSVAPVANATGTPAPSATAGADVNLTVTPRAPGTCAISLTGSFGVTATIPVSVALQDITPAIVWNASLGPTTTGGSGKLNNLLVDPTNASVMYVAGGSGANDDVQTSAGIYKSVNGGVVWSPADFGLTDPTVNALWMDPNNSQILLAATLHNGIFRSTNGAASWQPVLPNADVSALVAANTTIFAATDSGVWASHDDGVTWTNAYPTPYAAESVAVNGASVYIGDVEGNLYLATNGGAPKKIYTFSPLEITPDVHAIVIDPLTPQTMYASIRGYSNAIYSGNLYVSTTGGTSWTLVPIAVADRGAQTIALSAVTPHELYVLGTGCLASIDTATTFTPCGFYGDGRGFLPDPALPAADVPTGGLGSEPLLVTGDQGAVIGSSSGAGYTVTAGLSVNILRSLVVSGSNIATTEQDWPPFVTSTAGQSWQFASTDSSENGFLFENPLNPMQCYLFDNELRISTDGCKTFTDDPAVGGPSGGTTMLAFDPSASPRAYLATQTGVYVTTDGVTFTPTGWPISSPANVAVDALNPKTIFVSAATGSGFGVVCYTNDGGATWHQSTGISPSSLAYQNDAPVIAISPAHDNIVFAATGTQMFRSIDGGATFTTLQTFGVDSTLARSARIRSLQLRRGETDDDDLSTRSGRFRGRRSARAQAESPVGAINVGETLAFADNAPAGAVVPLVYVLPGRQLLTTTDYGGHWHDISANSISKWFSEVAFQHGTMYVATQGNGVIVSANTLVGATAGHRRRVTFQLPRRRTAR